ncbi:DUF4149 domain-containing protein [Inhella crocodyli]|uniref:DUF4149 domain-containing protein n=1 Tax=Inhella crocodyli TaxID=2499851 RepID=A0A437LS26_9BURK|nr:DUF4149 domain-containing protein [Inhella crocodyli]
MALMAAPNAFATLARTEAGAYVGRLFWMDARVSMLLGVLLLLVEQRRQRQQHEGRVVFNRFLTLPAAAVFLAVLGYDALQPWMAQAKSGQASASFALLHAASLACFGAKALVVAALAWASITSCDSSAGKASRA